MSTNILNIWKQIAWLSVGGLTEIGFGQDERFLLILSWQGRGVIDTTTGQKVARHPEAPCDDLPWLSEQSNVVIGIGPIEGEAVHCVGLWGGVLPISSGRFSVRPRDRRGSRRLKGHPRLPRSRAVRRMERVSGDSIERRISSHLRRTWGGHASRCLRRGGQQT
jgi:hypothetical protein